jgi:hypothetical protein
MLSSERFEYCLGLIRGGDDLGVEMLHFHYFYHVMYTALKNVKDVSLAAHIVDVVIASIINTVNKLDKIKDPNIFIYTVTDRVSKRFQANRKIPVYENKSEAKKRFVEDFCDLTLEEQEVFLLFAIYRMEEKDVAEFLDKTQGEVEHNRQTAIKKLKYSLQMFA